MGRRGTSCAAGGAREPRGPSPVRTAGAGPAPSPPAPAARRRRAASQSGAGRRASVIGGPGGRLGAARPPPRRGGRPRPTSCGPCGSRRAGRGGGDVAHVGGDQRVVGPLHRGDLERARADDTAVPGQLGRRRGTCARVPPTDGRGPGEGLPGGCGGAGRRVELRRGARHVSPAGTLAGRGVAAGLGPFASCGGRGTAAGSGATLARRRGRGGGAGGPSSRSRRGSGGCEGSGGGGAGCAARARAREGWGGGADVVVVLRVGPVDGREAGRADAGTSGYSPEPAWNDGAAAAGGRRARGRHRGDVARVQRVPVRVRRRHGRVLARVGGHGRQFVGAVPGCRRPAAGRPLVDAPHLGRLTPLPASRGIAPSPPPGGRALGRCHQRSGTALDGPSRPGR